MAEVKRLARAQGISAHELARRIGRDQSTVHNHLRPGKNRTQQKVADLYAAGLQVDREYLQILASGVIGPTSYEAASRALRRALEDSLPALVLDEHADNGSRVSDLWKAVVIAAGKDAPRAASALAIPLLAEMRVCINADHGIYEKTPEPFELLKQTLDKLGIDVAPYRARVAPSVLVHFWLGLGLANLHPQDKSATMNFLRDRLRARGDYSQEMDEILEAGKRDPRTIP